MIIVTANHGLLSFPSEGSESAKLGLDLARRCQQWLAIATVVAAFDSYRFGCRITPALSASRSTLQ